jgi:hypothetical protein
MIKNKSNSHNNLKTSSTQSSMQSSQISKPPYIPSPIRMTIIENGLSTDKIETKIKNTSYSSPSRGELWHR